MPGVMSMPLHVPQLAHVEVASPGLAASRGKMSGEPWIRRWPRTTPPPWLPLSSSEVKWGASTEELGLLDLQEGSSSSAPVSGITQQRVPAAHPTTLRTTSHDPVAAQRDPPSLPGKEARPGLQQLLSTS